MSQPAAHKPSAAAEPKAQYRHWSAPLSAVSAGFLVVAWSSMWRFRSDSAATVDLALMTVVGLFLLNRGFNEVTFYPKYFTWRRLFTRVRFGYDEVGFVTAFYLRPLVIVRASLWKAIFWGEELPVEMTAAILKQLGAKTHLASWDQGLDPLSSELSRRLQRYRTWSFAGAWIAFILLGLMSWALLAGFLPQ